MRCAIYPGSFDPITYGHLDIIKRTSHFFDEFIVLVSNTPRKKYLFSAEERVALIKQCLSDLTGIQVDIHDGLTVEYARKRGAQSIIRGIRVVADFEYEMAMANINKKLAPEVETFTAFAGPEYGYISSRLVKEVAFYHGDLSNLVPLAVQQALHAKKGYQ